MRDVLPNLTLLAAAVVVRQRGDVPLSLEPQLRHACGIAWRALELVLAAPAVRQHLARITDERMRADLRGLLETFPMPSSPAVLARIRQIRHLGVFDRELDMRQLEMNVVLLRSRSERTVDVELVDEVRRDLEDAGVALDEETLAFLLNTARVIFAGRVGREWRSLVTRFDASVLVLESMAETLGRRADELDALLDHPVQIDENVQFTVYRPHAIESARWHTLLAFAHLSEHRPGENSDDPRDEVRRQAEALLGEQAAAYQALTQDSGTPLPAEGQLTFVPAVEGIEFQPPSRSFLWLEPVHREEFRMRAVASRAATVVRGQMTVFLGNVVIADIPLRIRIENQKADAKRERTNARAYRKIFASYSHRDLGIVQEFERFAAALGDQYMRDWKDLRAGEVWNPRLIELIEQADIFQLFWSTNSMKSVFVRQEYEHALRLKRANFVRPTYWEQPMPTAPGLPSEELKRLHFQRLVVGARSNKEPVDGASRGKFRETMWFKKAELHAQAAIAAAEERARTGKDVANDKADSITIDERYNDDGSITRSDREKYSLRTGATSMMSAERDAPPRSWKGGPALEKRSAGRGALVLIAVLILALILYIILS